MPIGDTLGSVLVEMIDNGTPQPTPRITCEPVGRITSGWFDQHVPFIEREIERAQARVRLVQANTAPVGAPRRRRA
jgi:hypothetical protein